MNYQRIHDEIIGRALVRNKPECYCERHHVHPKSMGGTNANSNLVYLTAREHYIVHWLLFKIHKNQEMAFAWNRMTHGKSSVKRYVSHTFAYAKKARVEYLSKMFTGRVLTEEHKGKLSAAKLAKTYAEIGRAESTLRGRKLSDEHKMKVSLASTGRNHTEETKRKLSASRSGVKNPMFGKTTDLLVAMKISKALKGRVMPHKRLMNSANTSGIVGVSYSESRKKWCASICINGKFINLGRYSDFQKAAEARRYAEIKFLEGPHDPRRDTVETLAEVKRYYAAKARELRA